MAKFMFLTQYQGCGVVLQTYDEFFGVTDFLPKTCVYKAV